MLQWQYLRSVRQLLINALLDVRRAELGVKSQIPKAFVEQSHAAAGWRLRYTAGRLPWKASSSRARMRARVIGVGLG